MTIIDIFITACLLFGFVRGVIKGFFVEVASLVALIGGVYGAIHFSDYVSDILKNHVSWDTKYISLAAFAITFVLIIVLISLLGKALTKLADFAALGILNKIIGGIFGAVKIGLIVSVGFIFFDKINAKVSFVKKETLNTSVLYQPIKKIVPTIFPSIIKLEKKVDTPIFINI